MNKEKYLNVLGFYPEAMNELMEFANDSIGIHKFCVIKNIPPETPERYVPIKNYQVSHFDLEDIDFKLEKDDLCTLGVVGPRSKEIVFNLFKEKFGLSKENFINLIHPTAFISKSAKLDYGIKIEPKCVISVLCEIGFGVHIKINCVIGHHSKIGDYVTINPSVKINGLVEIGNNTLIGAGAIIKDNLKIGSNCVIGMGSVVLKDVPDNSRVFGNPARLMKSDN